MHVARPPAIPANGLIQVADAKGPVVIGKVTEIHGQAWIVHNGQKIPAKAEAPVFQGDSVETADGAQVSLVFADRSTFVLKDKGAVALDEFSYDPATHSGKEMFLIAKGGFNFVSGDIAKSGPDNAVLATPAVTVGIRGTTVGGTIGDGGATSLALLPDPGSNFVGEIAVGKLGGGDMVVINTAGSGIVGATSTSPFTVTSNAAAAIASSMPPPAPPPPTPPSLPAAPGNAPGGDHGPGGDQHGQGSGPGPAPATGQPPVTAEPPPTPPPLPPPLAAPPTPVPEPQPMPTDPGGKVGFGFQPGLGSQQQPPPPNRDPKLSPQEGSMGFGTDVATAVTGTVNATDPEGDSLSLSQTGSVPTLGSLAISGLSWTYTPTGTPGTDSFDITVSDGRGGTVVQHEQVTVVSSGVTSFSASLAGGINLSQSALPVVATGTTGADKLVGSSGNDSFAPATTGSGNAFFGGAGTDTLDYSSSAVALTVNVGAGTTSYASGSDQFAGVEKVMGSAQDDHFIVDSAWTSAVGNSLMGGGGTDTLEFTATTVADADFTHMTGFSRLRLENGQSVVLTANSQANGIVTVDASDTSVGVSVDALARTDGLSFIGGSGNDVITGGTVGDVFISDGSGADSFTGGGGANTFSLTGLPTGNIVIDDTGGSGTLNFASTAALSGEYAVRDVAWSGSNIVLTFVGGSTLTLTPGTTEVVTDSTGHSTYLTAYGGSNNDDIVIGAGANAMTGLNGSDVMIWAPGTPSMDGGAISASEHNEADFRNATGAVVADLTTADINSSAYTVTLSNIDGLGGGDYNDTLTGGAGDEHFMGRDGTNVINGAGGFDTVSYRDAVAGVVVDLAAATGVHSDGTTTWTDTFTGIEGVDGSEFNDTLTASGGTDRLNGFGGSDSLIGGAGSDTFVISKMGFAEVSNVTAAGHVDTFELSNSWSGLGSSGTLAGGSYAEDSSGTNTMTTTSQNFGAGAGVVVMDDGSGGASIWYTSDLSAATTSNSFEMAHVDVDTTALDNTHFVLHA
jgi:hypothetical protein